MPYYRAGEILDKAVEMERKGASFYQALAEQKDDQRMKDAFLFLAEEERNHEVAVTKLRDEFGEYRAEFSWDFEDYLAGLQLMSDQGIFEEGGETVSRAVLALDPVTLLKVAIQLEKDSILYYNELRQFVEPSAFAAMDELIRQEKTHIIKIRELLGRVTSRFK